MTDWPDGHGDELSRISDHQISGMAEDDSSNTFSTRYIAQENDEPTHMAFVNVLCYRKESPYFAWYVD